LATNLKVIYETRGFMKYSLGYVLIFSLMSCGKMKSQNEIKATSYGLESLTARGISFHSNDPQNRGRVLIVCSGNAAANQDRLNELSNLRQSLNLMSSNSRGFETEGVVLNPTEASMLFQTAENSLRLGQTQSTQCPLQILSAI
jgi:hypothetical protein